MNLEPSCSRTILALPWLANGSLPAESRRRVREHLIRCPACREELARTRATLAMFATTENHRRVRAENWVVALRSPKASLGRGLRRLSWAAAAAVIVAALGGVWAAHSPDREQTPAALVARSSSAAKGPAREPQLIFRDDFDSGTPNGWQQQF